MNTQDNNSYTLTFNQDSMTVTISGTSAFILNWGSSPYSNITCSRELGFNKQDTTSSTSVTSPNVVSLERPTSLYISIKEFLQSGVDTNQQYYSFNIPINVPSGYMIEYKREKETQKIEFISPINLTTLNIILYIENNEPANLNGNEFTMTLKINCC